MTGVQTCSLPILFLKPLGTFITMRPQALPGQCFYRLKDTKSSRFISLVSNELRGVAVNLVWIKQGQRVLFYFFSFRIIPVSVASQIFSLSGAARNVRTASAR